MKAAYFDCFAGAAGDMVVGALVDAGAPPRALLTAFERLGLSGYSVRFQTDRRGPVAGTRFIVETLSPAGPGRSLKDILEIIGRAGLSPRVAEGAAAVFRRLAEAEARVHGTDVGAVHFHEVGAVDAILDVVGALVALEALGIEAVFCSALPAGGGVVGTAHGNLPVPAPAVLGLLAGTGAVVVPAPTPEAARYELVTPTAAAIFATLARFEQPAMKVEAVGYGLGARHLESLPNALRVWVGEVAELPTEQTITLLETNIDDMPAELCGYLMERLFEAGARDVWFTPIQMKKNRPGILVSVLAPAALEDRLLDIIFRETTTLGVRRRPVGRHEAARELFKFESSLGPAAVKVKRWGGRPVNVSAEYEVCRELARRTGRPLQEIYRVVELEAWQKIAAQEVNEPWR